MARTWTTQWDMDSTIRSPRSTLRSLKCGSPLTLCAMHSVVERISDSIAARLCCTDKVGKARGSAFGAVATLTTSAAAASGARNIESPPDARILNRVREERHSQMHLAGTGVANIRRLWCPGNISQAERSFGGRRALAGEERCCRVRR